MGGALSSLDDEQAALAAGGRTPQDLARHAAHDGDSAHNARRVSALEELARVRAIAKSKSQARVGKAGKHRAGSRDAELSAAELALEVEVAGRERYTKWRLVDVRGAWRRAQDIVPTVRGVLCASTPVRAA